MINYKKALLSNIEKISSELRDEGELELVLKKRLTKKEFKVFCAIESEKELDEVAKLANCDKERVEQLHKSVIKKLNQEKIKQEFVRVK